MAEFMSENVKKLVGRGDDLRGKLDGRMMTVDGWGLGGFMR